MICTSQKTTKGETKMLPKITGLSVLWLFSLFSVATAVEFCENNDDTKSEHYLCCEKESDAKMYLPMGSKFVGCEKVPKTNSSVLVWFISEEGRCMYYRTNVESNGWNNYQFGTKCGEFIRRKKE